MAEAQLFASQDEMTCSLCLEALSDPVSILCGHSFCHKCLTDYWDQRQECSCPQCGRTFTTRLKLLRNTFRAVKSCLTCMISYCPTHLQPHFEIAAWKDHKLTNPVENLKEKICAKHQKSLEMFCEADGTCICVMCGETEHEGHKMVMLEMEKKEKLVSWVLCLMEKITKVVTGISESSLAETSRFRMRLYYITNKCEQM
uniref:Uncharacterized protein n=1 Tax=Erpetoichthys calabaricus TaxID=27687 RepID=A0A8C4TSF6_ERPCA